ncbi:MAG: hypothetical protein WCI26_02500 [Acidimicrobiales bacterium]
MLQGQKFSSRDSTTKSHGGTRRMGIAFAVLATLGSAAFGVIHPDATAAGATAPTAKVTTTTVATPTPTTTVTTTTSPRSTTTSTTTVTTQPTTVTTTTVTRVTPTTTGTTGTTQPIKATTTTTTTTVPVAPTTTAPTTTAPTTTAPTTTRSDPKPTPKTTTTTTTAPSPGPASFDPTCTKSALPNLQDYINSLPAGSVFQSSTTACYLVPDGILLSKPITIIGGTFYDPLVERLTNVRPYGALHPIILIKNTSHVTLSGVSVLGANTIGGYHADLVGEAGVKIMSSSDLVLTGVSAKNTFGDGLELVANFTDHINTPVNRLSVDGFTTINAGRQGITVAELTNSTLNNLNVISPAASGIDFESDLPYQGSGNVAITNCVNEAGFNMVEYYTGPITITNCTGFHHVTLRTDQKVTPITFVGGTLTCKRAVPQPCIDVTGGSLTFTGVTIARMPGVLKISTPVWSVERAGTLRFDRSPIETGFGTVLDAASVNFAR